MSTSAPVTRARAGLDASTPSSATCAFVQKEGRATTARRVSVRHLCMTIMLRKSKLITASGNISYKRQSLTYVGQMNTFGCDVVKLFGYLV